MCRSPLAYLLRTFVCSEGDHCARGCTKVDSQLPAADLQAGVHMAFRPVRWGPQ